MNRNTTAQTTTARVINALLCALAPDDKGDADSELLKHFPFARVGEQASSQTRLHMQTTAHGSL